MSTFALSGEQQEYLDSLVCQRISDDAENREVIKNFVNFRADNIVAELRKGLPRDRDDRVAYYIIKDQDQEPLLFFSLKCGETHLPLSLEKLEKAVADHQALLDAVDGEEAPDWAVQVIEKRKVDGEVPMEKVLQMYEEYIRSVKRRDNYLKEIRLEGNNIIRTKKTFAGLELVHFCSHDPARDKWKKAGMDARKMGKTLFWHFVVPVIQEVRKLVGCEYFYLFAADQEREGKLTGYYQELGFEFREDLYVTKPQYDFGCYFMCQKVTSLRNRGREFFANYNNPQDPHKK